LITLSVLTPDEIEAVHQATLRILSEVGIQLSQPEALELLYGAGATVKDGRLCLPPELVEWAVGLCPPTVTLRGRGGQSLTLGDGSLHWHNLGGARDIYDPVTDTVRPATVKDVSDAARLLDALESVTSITPFFTPQDVPGKVMSLAMYRHTLPNTTKPAQGPGVQTAAEVRLAVRMAEVIVVENTTPGEMLSLGISPVSPLLYPDDVVEAMLEAARLGVTISPLPCPTAGATAPLSLAGALAQQNAEVLASVVIAQIIRPGLPMVYCGRLAMMEPRTGMSVWGGVELGLVSAATVQLAHRYHLPVNVYGLSTNSHSLDIQNGYERALNAAIPALAGADELSGIGEMQAGVAGSFAQMVCDSEIAASVKRLRRGFAVDEDALAVDLIATVMAGSHNFLDQMHTVRYLRAGEIYITRLAARGSWEEWERGGRLRMAEHAQAQVELILARHQVPPLAPEQERELDVIMSIALRE
jgi:trimethylamine---corrinoid protein Co-methyltransferase